MATVDGKGNYISGTPTNITEVPKEEIPAATTTQ